MSCKWDAVESASPGGVAECEFHKLPISSIGSLFWGNKSRILWPRPTTLCCDILYVQQYKLGLTCYIRKTILMIGTPRPCQSLPKRMLTLIQWTYNYRKKLLWSPVSINTTEPALAMMSPVICTMKYQGISLICNSLKHCQITTSIKHRYIFSQGYSLFFFLHFFSFMVVWGFGVGVLDWV